MFKNTEPVMPTLRKLAVGEAALVEAKASRVISSAIIHMNKNPAERWEFDVEPFGVEGFFVVRRK